MTTKKSDSELLKTFFTKLLKRCYSNTSPAYAEYGALGATVCDEWRNRCNAFIDWSLANGYYGGLSLYRIDPRKPYGPDNCQWAFREPTKKRTGYARVQVVFKGRQCYLVDLINQYHQDAKHAQYNLIYSRIFQQKWSIEKALTTPGPGYQPLRQSRLAAMAA